MAKRKITNLSSVVMTEKIHLSARAIFLLSQDGLLYHPLLKGPIKELIRQASETTAYHATTHYRSKAVEFHLNECGVDLSSASKYHKYCSTNFSHEHVVPVEVVYRILIGEKAPAEVWIRDVLERFSIRATITKGENNKLLKDKMPEEFHISGEPEFQNLLFQNPLARYMKENFVPNLVKRDIDMDSWV